MLLEIDIVYFRIFHLSVPLPPLTEEHALLFSVCRFRELTGRYPQNITVSKGAALKGEAAVRAQFRGDPYGCLGFSPHEEAEEGPISSCHSVP